MPQVRTDKSQWIADLGDLAFKAEQEGQVGVAVILQQAVRAMENDIETQAAIVIRGFVDERLKRIQALAQSRGARRRRQG